MRVKIGRVSSKHQVTLPIDLMRAARITPGDHVRFDLDERRQITVAPVRSAPDMNAFLGIWKGRTRYANGRELAEDLRGPVEG